MQAGGDAVKESISAGEACFENKQYDDAITHYRNALDSEKTHFPSLIGLAKTLLELSNPTGANRWLKEALLINPNHSEALKYHAIALFELGDYLKAIECAQKALAIEDKPSTILLLYLGKSFLYLGHYTEALECFLQLSHDEHYCYTGFAHLCTGNYYAAKIYFSKVSIPANDASLTEIHCFVSWGWGLLCRLEGNSQEADSLIDKARRLIKSDKVEQLLLLQSIVLKTLKEERLALACLDTISDSVHAILQKGLLYLHQKKYEPSQCFFTAVLKSFPENELAQVYLDHIQHLEQEHDLTLYQVFLSSEKEGEEPQTLVKVENTYRKLFLMSSEHKLAPGKSFSAISRSLRRASASRENEGDEFSLDLKSCVRSTSFSAQPQAPYWKRQPGTSVAPHFALDPIPTPMPSPVLLPGTPMPFDLPVVPSGTTPTLSPSGSPESGLLVSPRKSETRAAVGAHEETDAGDLTTASSESVGSGKCACVIQ